MMRILINNWWLLALRGVFALTFAALAFSLRALLNTYLMNAIAAAVLVVIFGLLVLAVGLCTAAAGARGAAEGEKSWWLLAEGVALSSAGVLIMVDPQLTLGTLAHIVAACAAVIGICELFLAHTVRRHIPDEWILALSGVVSMFFVSYLIFRWTHEPIAIGKWIGIYAGFMGVATLGLAFRLRALRDSIHKLAASTAG